MTARDMSVFDDIERQTQIFAAVRYLERNAARRKKRAAAVWSSLAVVAGLAVTVSIEAWLLLAGGFDSVDDAAAVSALGTLPLLLGFSAYGAGFRYMRSVDRELAITDPVPLEPLLGVVRSSSEMK
jgi:hypothetical protein